jgi:hypothetical protein
LSLAGFPVSGTLSGEVALSIRWRCCRSVGGSETQALKQKQRAIGGTRSRDTTK